MPKCIINRVNITAETLIQMPNANLTEKLNRASKLIQSDFFREFLKDGIDRCTFILEWLTENKVPNTVVSIGNKKHIIVNYKSQNYDPRFKIKTIAVHYDREKNTQGANDNSAACIQLLLFAKYLLQFNCAHNIKIIFTDGEEAGANGIINQGSYLLGTGLRKLKMDKDDIFVFDMCGRGDVLILSQSGICGRPKKNTLSLDILHSESCAYAQEACPNQWISMLTPYSDNAGFIAAGLSAQVITVLPRSEAETLLRYLPKHISCEFFNAANTQNKTAIYALIDLIIKNRKPEINSPLAKIIPETWQFMHTPNDSLETLTPEAFILIEKYLQFLANVKRI